MSILDQIPKLIEIAENINNISNTISSINRIVSPLFSKEKLTYASDFLKKMADYWKKETIVFIGPTASGKDSVLAALHGEDTNKVHSQTRGLEKVNSYTRTFHIEKDDDIKLRLSSTINVGGEIDQRERYWLDACKPCDIIFYLVDCGEFIKNNERCVCRIKDDLEWLVSKSSDFKKGFKIVIILNKIDLVTNDDIPEEDKKKIIAVLLSEIKCISTEILSVLSDRLLCVLPLSTIKKNVFVSNFTEILKEVMEKNS